MNQTTQYGFNWGPVIVERLAHVEGRGYALRIATEHQELQVYVSEAGRKIKPMTVRAVPQRSEVYSPAPIPLEQPSVGLKPGICENCLRPERDHGPNNECPKRW